jgi:hypothetical protein
MKKKENLLVPNFRGPIQHWAQVVLLNFCFVSVTPSLFCFVFFLSLKFIACENSNFFFFLLLFFNRLNKHISALLVSEVMMKEKKKKEKELEQNKIKNGPLKFEVTFQTEVS